MSTQAQADASGEAGSVPIVVPEAGSEEGAGGTTPEERKSGMRWIIMAVLFGIVGCVDWPAYRAEFYERENTGPATRILIDQGKLWPGMSIAEALLVCDSGTRGWNANPWVEDGRLMVDGRYLRVILVPNLRVRMFFTGDGRLVSWVQR